VDDFAVKYGTDADAHHLRNALLQNYEITTDWGGTVYSGITLKWDYGKCTCDISMPGYVNNVFKKNQHDNPKTPQHTPSKYVAPVYGAKIQYAPHDETPPSLCQAMQHYPKDNWLNFILLQSSLSHSNYAP
jgi:hypothetical protein